VASARKHLQPDLDKQAKADAACEIPPDAVLAALDTVIASAAFSNRQRQPDSLRHLVETLSAGSHLA